MILQREPRFKDGLETNLMIWAVLVPVMVGDVRRI